MRLGVEQGAEEHFRVIRALGRGGMGAVELVEDRDGGRFARKRLEAAEADERARLAFRREFHTLASLRHPAIVRAHEFGSTAGALYYTMEFLEGPDLHELGATDWRRACAILRDVASALALLHSRRLVHRDIKPRNVKLDGRGAARLIDFGVMTTVGSNVDIAGTPAYMAPEVLSGVPIDHRTDLYALGALAYWLVAGSHAFAVRRVEELPAAWKRRPARLSTIRPDVPSRFEDLVADLLAQDPMARPSSAAEVIESLTAIADLDPETSARRSSARLQSPGLAGRRREVERIVHLLKSWDEETPPTVLLTGASGMGKSRLLREVVLQSQLAGATPIEISCTPEMARARPYAALARLARGLMQRDSTAVVQAARPVIEDLCAVLPEIATAAGYDGKPRGGDAVDTRLRAIDAVRSWFAALPRRLRPVAIVDDLQWCDEASAAVLAGVQQSEGRPAMLLFAALRTDVPAVAGPAIRTLRDAGQTLRVRPLERDDVQFLLASMLVDAEHIDPLATALHKSSGGRPMLCIDLLHHLVDNGYIENVDGVWVIPPHPTLSDAPASLADASDARIQMLPWASRSVADAMAVVGRQAATDTIHRLTELGYQDLFAALDDLIARDIIGENRDELRLTHDALRESLLRGLSAEQKRTLHRRAAEALEATEGGDGEAVEPSAEIGWHWLEGGEDLRGAEILAQSGLRRFDQQAAAEATLEIEAALDVYERTQTRLDLQFQLRLRLLEAGAMMSLPVLDRYAASTLEWAWSLAGLRSAQAMSRWLGRPLAVVVGFCVAWMRWIAFPGARSVANPAQALEGALVAIYVLCACAAHRADVALEAALRPRLDLLLGLRIGIPYGLARCGEGFLGMPRWRPAEVLAATADAIRASRRDWWTPVGDFERRGVLATAHNTALHIDAFEMEPTLFDRFEDASKYGLRVVGTSHAAIEAMFHHARGELPQARRARAQFERDQAAIGRAWMWDGLLTWFTPLACAWNRDVLGMRRSIAHLEVLIRENDYRQVDILRLVQGEYHRERGELDRSREILEALDAEVSDYGFAALATPLALAETLLGLGALQEAEQAATRGLERATSERMRSRAYEVRARRVSALIHGAQGRLADAEQELSRALAVAEISGSPTLVGSVYEARAQLAYAAGDEASLAEACMRLRDVYAPTENPILIARAERLASLREERGAGSHDLSELATVYVAANPVLLLHARLGSLRSTTERYCAALDLLLELSTATAGYVYVCHDTHADLVAPDAGAEPPLAVEEAVRAEGWTSRCEVEGGWVVYRFGDPARLAIALLSPSTERDLDRVLAAVSETFSSMRSAPGGADDVSTRAERPLPADHNATPAAPLGD